MCGQSIESSWFDLTVTVGGSNLGRRSDAQCLIDGDRQLIWVKLVWGLNYKLTFRQKNRLKVQQRIINTEIDLWNTVQAKFKEFRRSFEGPFEDVIYAYSTGWPNKLWIKLFQNWLKSSLIMFWKLSEIGLDMEQKRIKVDQNWFKSSPKLVGSPCILGQFEVNWCYKLPFI